MTSATTDRRQGLVGNIPLKAPVTVAAAGNITLSGQQTIDGVAVLAINSAGVPDRVLCMGQTNPVDNGIWDVSTASWTRSIDANGNYDLAQGSTVLVNGGATFAGSYWKIDTSGSITIGTTALAWSRALASSISTLSFLQAGAGTILRPAQDKMREAVSAADFSGVDPTGAANSTAGLLNFFTYCISTGYPGRIPAGTYKVTTGVFVFDNGFTDKAWPHIFTAGAQATIFNIDPATETNAPLFQWKNGVANSSSGKYWRGGSFGGVTVNGSQVGAANTSQHHFSFTGMWAINFGYMVSNYCKGNSYDIPQNLYLGVNPDPYACSFINVQQIESNFSSGYAFHNANFVGMDSWNVDHVRIIQPALGGWFGIGSGCFLRDWSVANVTGWAFDDGTFVNHTGGAPQRNYIGPIEMDNCQNGVRINTLSRSKLLGVRFPTRFQTAPNVAAVYWPLIGVDVAGGASAAVFEVELELQWRVEAGGVLANLGTYIQTTANGRFNATVDYLDNGALGITNSNFLTNCTLRRDTPCFITRTSTPLYDSRDRAFSFARGSAATTVPNSGYGAAGSVLAFPAQLSDLFSAASIYNTGTNAFTAPRTGWYRVEISVALTVAAGTRIRLGVWDGSSVIANSDQYAPSANAQNYSFVCTLSATKGATFFAVGNQNTASATVACTPIVTNSEVRFVVQEI